MRSERIAMERLDGVVPLSASIVHCSVFLEEKREAVIPLVMSIPALRVLLPHRFFKRFHVMFLALTFHEQLNFSLATEQKPVKRVHC